jgi:chromate transport protein ChrA
VALVSFGGAYAVLPYVAHGAVEQYGWLSAAQMVDGLALGETTPGPLIMVVAFVGVLAGWNQSGSLGLALAAGLVVVWFTFLPSFLFILVGGPLVEASRGDLRLDGPLSAITAAVVGTIAHLAVLFSDRPSRRAVQRPGALAGGRRSLARSRRRGLAAADAGAAGALALERAPGDRPGGLAGSAAWLAGRPPAALKPGPRHPPSPAGI